MSAPTDISLRRNPSPTPDLARRTPPSALPELMDGPCTRAELRACLRDLAWINRVLFGYRPILTWLSHLRPQLTTHSSPQNAVIPTDSSPKNATFATDSSPQNAVIPTERSDEGPAVAFSADRGTKQLDNLQICHPDDQREEGPAFALRSSVAPSPLRPSAPSSLPLRILDVGSGYGDTLREISAWARRRNLPVELTGFDLNPETTAIATEATSDPHIRFVTADAFSYTPSQPPHLIVTSLVTHHLEDVEIVRLLQWMEANATVGWFINDLSRHPAPYYLFRWFSRAVHLHPFVQHDGPVSFARAFQPQDWISYCTAASLPPNQIEVRGYTPGRLCVSRIKPAPR